MIDEELKAYCKNFDLSTLYPKPEPKHRKKHKKHKFGDLVKERDSQWPLDVLKFAYEQKEAELKNTCSHKVECHGHGEFYSDYEIAHILLWQEYEEERRKLLGLPKEKYQAKPITIHLIRREFPNLEG